MADSTDSLNYRRIGLIAVLLTLLMRMSALWKPHIEGDERVYLALAKAMHWNLGHYTTRDDPAISNFPDVIYNSPLFHHPPLFPLVLKIGQVTFFNPEAAGLWFANFAMIVLIYYTGRLMIFLEIPSLWGMIAYAGVTFCPLLLSSSMMLHHDAIMGCFMTSGIVAYLQALHRPTWGRAIEAAVLFVIGMNTRYNSLLYLPCLLVLPCFIGTTGESNTPGIASKPNEKRQARQLDRWTVCAIVMVLVMTLGMSHYYRVLATYGSLFPSSFLKLKPNAAEFSTFMQFVAKQTRLTTSINLTLIYPILIAFVIPFTYGPVIRDLRTRSYAAWMTLIFLYLFTAEMVFSFSQVRYFATVMPCLYLSLPYLIRSQRPWQQTILLTLAACSLLTMITTGFLKTQIYAAGQMFIVPSAYYYIPGLGKFME